MSCIFANTVSLSKKRRWKRAQRKARRRPRRPQREKEPRRRRKDRNQKGRLKEGQEKVRPPFSSLLFVW